MATKVFDEEGRKFDSLSACVKFHGGDPHLLPGSSALRLRTNGIVHWHGHTITLDESQYVYMNKQLQAKPAPASSQPDPILAKLKERYSDKEIEMIARGEGIQKRFIPYPEIHLRGEHHRMAVISDTHIGSIYSPEEWHDAVSGFVNDPDNNVDCVLHCGDIVEGLKIGRAGTQIYELSALGFDAQREKAIELMSKYEKPVYIISGNHDMYFKEFAGANIVQSICDAVPNMTYIGHDSADIDVGGCTIRLFHGGDGSCFTEGTEILTRGGWVDFKDLTVEMEVATMTKEGHIFEWQHPTKVTKEWYVGDTYSFKNRKFDFEVTPNHRLWVKYNRSINRPLSHGKMPQKAHMKYDDDWHPMTATDIAESWRKQKWVLPTAVNGYRQTDFTESVDIPRIESRKLGEDKQMFHAGNLPIEDVAELIAWYVTEGHTTKYATTISQYKAVNPGKYERILNLAKRIGCNYTASERSVTLHGKELAEYLKANCGAGSRNVHIPDFIKNNSKEILDLVLDTCIDGDGWRSNTSTGQLGYRSISPRLLTDVAEIALKLGYSVSFGRGGESISLSKVQVEPSMVRRPERKSYEGNIYCCSVPNELIYVRKNGRCFFSLNSYALSYRLQKLVEAITGGHKPNILLAGHVHKFCYIFERNIHAISVPTMQMQTSFMRGKKLAAHTGFLILDFEAVGGSISNLSLQLFPFYG